MMATAERRRRLDRPMAQLRQDSLEYTIRRSPDPIPANPNDGGEGPDISRAP